MTLVILFFYFNFKSLLAMCGLAVLLQRRVHGCGCVDFWGRAMIRFFEKALLVALGVSLFACTDTSFKAGADKKGATVPVNQTPLQPTDKTLRLECTNGQGEARLVTDVRGTAHTTARIEGEFCGLGTATQTGHLTALFVIDFSGSMQNNDPLDANGSCGRLAAVGAIVNRLQTSLGQGVDVRAGLLAFSDQAEGAVQPIDLNSFKAHLNAHELCQADGGTNYEAAFTTAATMLQGLDGQKVVYFISDGLPTSSLSAGPVQDFSSAQVVQAVFNTGRQSAAALRASAPDLTLNAIYLAGVPSSEDQQLVSLAGVDPQTYLGQVTGAPDHVRQAASAADLAAQIQTFQTPTAASFDASSVQGTLVAANFGQQTVSVASLTKDPTRDGVWDFVTQPFTLQGTSATPVDNTVTLSIKGADGQIHTATAIIHFAVGQ